MRRGVINERYGEIIDAMYRGERTIDVDTTIAFQDGTKQRIRTVLNVIALDPATPSDSKRRRHEVGSQQPTERPAPSAAFLTSERLPHLCGERANALRLSRAAFRLIHAGPMAQAWKRSAKPNRVDARDKRGHDDRPRTLSPDEGRPMISPLLFQLIINGLIIGTLYGVVGMCFVLIYKASQVVNFAQGEFLLIGAWTCWYLMTAWQIPFFWGFLVSIAFMMVFGLLVQMLVLRPLIGERSSPSSWSPSAQHLLPGADEMDVRTFAQPFPPSSGGQGGDRRIAGAERLSALHRGEHRHHGGLRLVL